MAQVILVSPDQLRSDAAKLKSYAEQDGAIIQQLTNLVLSLDDIWKGEAQTAFVTRFQSARQQFNSFNKTLASFAEMMETTAKNMENADLSLKQRISAIS